jgi:hypothetical protein
MRTLVSLSLVVVGLIHLLPLPGLFGGTQLAALYGLPFDDPNLLILMRHRALLFGLLGGYCVVAAFRPSLQASALIAAWISVAGFLLLAWSAGGYNAQIARVVIADLVALVSLVAGSVALYRLRRG